MPLTAYPNGLSSFGIPVLPPGLSIPQPRANTPTIFVDATYGGDSNSGLDPSRPVATIAVALTKAKAGSTIFIFPGTYATTAKTVSLDYITLIGAQYAGYARPDIGAPSAGVPLTVTGQGFRAIGCRFYGTASDAVVQQGNGFQYSDCVFDGDLTASKCGLRLLPSSTNTHLTASEGSIQNNLFRSSAIGIGFDTGAAPVGVGSTDNLIQTNVFDRNVLDLASLDAGSAIYSLQFTKILNNAFIDKLKATYIDFTTTNGGAASDQSGIIAGNYFAIDKGPAAAPTTTQFKMVGTAFTFVGNYGTVGLMDGSGLD